MSVPGLASDENLAGVHDPARQTGSVDGAQGWAELDDVGPDQRLRQQTCMLPRWRFVLTLKEKRFITQKRSLYLKLPSASSTLQNKLPLTDTMSLRRILVSQFRLNFMRSSDEDFSSFTFITIIVYDICLIMNKMHVRKSSPLSQKLFTISAFFVSPHSPATLSGSRAMGCVLHHK